MEKSQREYLKKKKKNERANERETEEQEDDKQPMTSTVTFERNPKVRQVRRDKDGEEGEKKRKRATASTKTLQMQEPCDLREQRWRRRRERLWVEGRPQVIGYGRERGPSSID